MPQAIQFANATCLDRFLLFFFCKYFKKMSEAKQAIDTLREILYLYRSQGNLSAITGLVGAYGPAQLQTIVNNMNLYEDLTLSIMNQAIETLKGGVIDIINKVGIWKDLPKWEGYLTCPALQLLFNPINQMFIELSLVIEQLEFQYNYGKHYLQGIGQKNIINTDFFDSLISILDYLSDRINVLCAPFLG